MTTTERTAPRWPRPTLDWETRAKCRGVDDTGDDLFHPAVAGDPEANATATAAYERARAYCRQCPVTTECLTAGLYAEGNHTGRSRHGIWGGLSPSQRDDLEPGDDLAAAIRRALFNGSRAVNPRTHRQARASRQTGTWTDPKTGREWDLDELRAANRAHHAWRTKGGAPLDQDEHHTYLAYQRWTTARRNAHKERLRELLLDQLVAERFGSLSDLEHERPRPPMPRTAPDMHHDAEEATV